MIPMRNSILIFLIAFAFQSYAQTNFERVYKSPGEHLTALDLLTKESGDFVLLYLIDSIGMDENISIGITSLNQKGSENWSKQYYISDDLSVQSVRGELKQMDSGNYLVNVLIDTLSGQNLILELEPGGDVIKAEHFGSLVQVGDHTSLMTRGEAYHYAWNIENGGGSNTQRIRLFKDESDNISWAFDFSSVHSNGIAENIEIRDMISSYDENILISGNVIASQVFSKNASFISKLDSDGNPLWNTSFTYPIDQLVNFNVVGLSELADSSIVVSGNWSGGFVNSNNGFVVKFSKDGELLWFRSVVLGGGLGFDRFIEDHTILNDESTIVLAGYEPSPMVLTPFSISVSLEGDLIGGDFYTTNTNSFTPSMNIESTMDGGSAILSIQADSITNELAPYLIKSDPQGMTPCSGEIQFVNVVADTLAVDTMTLSRTEVVIDRNELNVLSFDYDALDLKVLSVENFNFCPNEPILATIDATVEEATSYQWNTGESTPTLTVDEEGIYMVTVTFNQDICYSLCDTSIVAVYNPPSVSIANDFSSFCTDGNITLTAVPNAESGVTNIIWSTGSTESSITVNDENTYSVTITDNCNIEASASTSTSFPELLENVNISFDAESYCESDTIVLSASANPGQVSGFSWSTGEETPTIIAGGPGTYAVTVFDFCLNELSTSVELDDTNLPDCTEDCLRFPNVFIPSSQEELNRTFGPLNLCNPDPTEYSLSVFNRWGQKVFETDNLATEWDGRYNEEALQGDVYVYYAKYVIEGSEKTAKGDVTLLR